MGTKNCENCRHLDWEAADCEQGFVCAKRCDYRSDKDQDMHLSLLEKRSYRVKGKKCFEPKEGNLNNRCPIIYNKCLSGNE